MIEPKAGPSYAIAQKTIKVCGLSDKRLFSARAAILASFRIFETDIRQALEEFDLIHTAANKEWKAANINDALSTIKELTLPKAKLSNYCLYMLEKSSIYQEAELLIQVYVDEYM